MRVLFRNTKEVNINIDYVRGWTFADVGISAEKVIYSSQCTQQYCTWG